MMLTLAPSVNVFCTPELVDPVVKRLAGLSSESGQELDCRMVLSEQKTVVRQRAGY